MTENKKRFRIDFTVDAEGWSDDYIKESAIQELTCMVPYPEDISFSEVDNPWHTGTPTEEGWYLIKYECIYEGRYKGNIAYSTFKIQIYDNGYIDFAGGIGSDEVWQPVEYLRIGDVWKPKETD